MNIYCFFFYIDTTLPEAKDRILSTSIDATWNYNISDISLVSQIPFDDIFSSIRQITLDIFATVSLIKVEEDCNPHELAKFERDQSNLIFLQSL